MFYLIVAILGSSMISIVFRYSEGRVNGRMAVLTVNYIVCVFAAWLDIGPGTPLPHSAALLPTLGMGLVNGVFYLLSLVLMQYNIKRNGVVLPALFARLGLLVPLLLSVCFFNEQPTIAQMAGTALAIAAIIVINGEKDQKKAGSKLMLLCLLLADGSASAMSKVYEQLGESALSAHFIFFTFVSALLICSALTLHRKERLGRQEILFGILVGLPNFFASRLLLRALEDIPAVIAYPLRGVACILVITCAGIFCFGERLKQRQWIALAIILIAIVLLNL